MQNSFCKIKKNAPIEVSASDESIRQSEKLMPERICLPVMSKPRATQIRLNRRISLYIEKGSNSEVKLH
ncbi:hypothetical protein TI10_16230 [Photorhabdus luminescens subsp. luminescens]|uniref:hypothetical protein n=1 Tax=Photorhabdus TaxID=29487 RepID=UPI00066DB98D|nr:hypothetical protein [Photorhabdus luminescens]KMW72120.1 hypothetical protein TI10_16230 [Photorhabdus luminescens subsp. luminescens]